MSAHEEVAEEVEGPKVLASATSAHGKVMRTIQVVRPSNDEASFLIPTAKGLGVTLKHFARNYQSAVVFVPGY